MVTRRIPDLEKDAGVGNTETDAPEFTRKFLEEIISLRYKREEEALAWRKNISSCRPVSFPSRRWVACTSGLCLRVFCAWNQQVEETGDLDFWWW